MNRPCPFLKGLYLHADYDSITVVKLAQSCLNKAMRCASDLLQSLAHHKYETLCTDIFTHEWNNLLEHYELYLLIFMESTMQIWLIVEFDIFGRPVKVRCMHS